MSLKSILPVKKQPSTLKVVNLDSSIESLGDEPQPSPSVSVKRLSPKDLPPKSAFTSDLPEFKQKRKELKNELKYEKFIEDMNQVLSLFEDSDNKKLILWVANSAEQYFNSPKSGDKKLKAVIELTKKYYHDDEKLVESVVELILPLVKKSTPLSRLLYKTRTFFLLLKSKK